MFFCYKRKMNQGFGALDKNLIHKVVRIMVANFFEVNWLEQHRVVERVLPLRLVNRHWRRAVDCALFFWARMMQTLPEWSRFYCFYDKPCKDTVVQFVRKRRAQKELRMYVFSK